MCLYFCVYIYIYIYIYIYNINIYLKIYIHLYTYIYIYEFMFWRLCIYKYKKISLSQKWTGFFILYCLIFINDWLFPLIIFTVSDYFSSSSFGCSGTYNCCARFLPPTNTVSVFFKFWKNLFFFSKFFEITNQKSKDLHSNRLSLFLFLQVECVSSQTRPIYVSIRFCFRVHKVCYFLKVYLMQKQIE